MLFHKNELKKFNKKFNEPYSEISNTEKYNTILSKNYCLGMNSQKTLRNNNILVIGGSGTGKSRFFIKPNILEANCSYVITDPSGKLSTSVGKYLEENGYKVKIFNLVDMEHSNLMRNQNLTDYLMKLLEMIQTVLF